MNAAQPLPRLLVVDDEPSVLETIGAILAQERYEVLLADSADAALDHLRASSFEVVLTDLRLEDASGLSIITELRQHWPDTVAIILTGYASLESAIGAVREGVYDYLIKPCEVEELKDTVQRAVERRALARGVEQRLQELDGTNVSLQAFCRELQDKVDRVTVELRHKVHELAEAKRQLEQSQRQRQEFMSMLAHELRQPLATIGGYAQLLERPRVPAATQERARTTIASETRRLARLVQDLADASRLAAGRFDLRLERCDLAEVIREQAEAAQVRSTEHSMRVDAPKRLPVTCDRDRLAQVLSNLLSNAIKYTPGGPIGLSARLEDESVLVMVRDCGPGIPPERLERLFEPSVIGARPVPGQSTSGTGLGLFIAKGIVEAHGGRITVECAPGEGTTCVFWLPLDLKPEGSPSGDIE